MTLSTRSIAIQGIGFGPRHVAVQGLTPTTDQAPISVMPAFRALPRKPKRRAREDEILLFILK